MDTNMDQTASTKLIPTGWSAFDRVAGGFKNGEFIMFGGGRQYGQNTAVSAGAWALEDMKYIPDTTTVYGRVARLLIERAVTVNMLKTMTASMGKSTISYWWLIQGVAKVAKVKVLNVWRKPWPAPLLPYETTPNFERRGYY